MQTLDQFTNQGIEYLFTDIDDTLTTSGKLLDSAYTSLWDLHRAGIKIIPVTGRPAGWCELIARLWPVSGVVGENGAFYFRLKKNDMIRSFAVEESQRALNSQKLRLIERQIIEKVPGAQVASDQFCRLFDLAIDFCEDVPPLAQEDIDRIVAIFEHHGASAKISSIHVNGWFGDYDKLSMCKKMAQQEFAMDLNTSQDQVAFVGDSPNDEPMFKFFKNSFAVANIKNFSDRLKHQPQFVAEGFGADGFAEISRLFLKIPTS